MVNLLSMGICSAQYHTVMMEWLLMSGRPLTLVIRTQKRALFKRFNSHGSTNLRDELYDVEQDSEVENWMNSIVDL